MNADVVVAYLSQTLMSSLVGDKQMR